MKEKVRILHLEDVPEDAELVKMQLRRDGLSFTSKLVDTREDFIRELHDMKPDLIIADYSLPSFNAMEAIEIAQDQACHIPIVVCTGSVGEDIAVDCIRAGAADYVIKEHITRLGTAVRGAIDRQHALDEKEKAERLLREKHEYVKNLIDSSLDMIIAVDSMRRVTEFNPAAERAFGYERDAVIGKHVNLLYSNPKQGLAIHKRTIINGQCVREIVNRRKSGETFPCLLSSSVLRDLNGEVVGVMGVSRDITQDKQDEELLQFQADILSNVRDSVIVSDAENRIVYWNAGAAMLYGYSADEMIGKSLDVLYPDQESEQVVKELDNLARGGDLSGTWRARTKNGSFIWAAIKTTPWQENSGNPTGYISISRDITRRKLAEEKLKLSDQIISHIENLVLVADKSGQVIFSGPSITHLLGYSVADVMGNGWFELTWRDEAERERELAYIKAAIEDRKKVRTEPYERRISDKSGATHWILWQEAVGPNNTLIAIGHDITEYKNLEAQLIQGEKIRAVGELAAGIAHEINSPIQFIGDNLHFLKDSTQPLIDALNVAKQPAELIRNKLPDSDVQGSNARDNRDDQLDYFAEQIPLAIEQSIDGVGRISEIVQAMRIFSHPGGKEKTSVDINEAIRSTATVTRNEWKYVAELQTDLDPDLPPVPCMAGEMNQVFLNLLVNAAQAIQEAMLDGTNLEKGIISISTCMAESDVMIRISDTGRGIPRELRDRVFEPFFTTKEVGKGTGQGLAIAHAVVVEKHGGSIAIESREGKGTSFIIRLPLPPA